MIDLQYIYLNNMVNCSNRCSDRFRDLEMRVKKKTHPSLLQKKFVI